MAALRTAAALACIAVAAFAAPIADAILEERQDTSAPYLHQAIVSAGKQYFGSEIDTLSGEQNNANYMKIFNDSAIFGGTTPGNTMKWEFVEPNQNQFTFTQGEQTVALAKATGKGSHLRCHNLVWYTELPSWVTNPSTPWTNQTLTAALVNHITKTVQGFGSSCYSWDVVNEAISDSNPATYRSNVFLEYIGPQYIPIAFSAAAAAAKSIGATIKLVYNDYNIESPGTKQAFAANTLIPLIKNSGAPIDGVGFESHFIVGQTPSTAAQQQAMQSFTSQGLEIFQTELDVRFSSLPPTTAGLKQQAADYYSTVQACMKTSQCLGVTVWDFDDAYSWIPGTFSGQGDADLYWANLTRKPAYEAVYQAITGAACTVCS